MVLQKREARVLPLLLVLVLVLANHVARGAKDRMSVAYGGLFAGNAPGASGRLLWDLILILLGLVVFPGGAAFLTWWCFHGTAVRTWRWSDLLLFVAAMAAVGYHVLAAPVWLHGMRLSLPEPLLWLIESGFGVLVVGSAVLFVVVLWLLRRVRALGGGSA